uniref:DNA-(apurinic or apyrimidinic site) lyase n=1 Tax=Aegilops tauschii subsp. strangulata TaxID=200361 RepID=A0A453DZI1_AEGTS
QDPVECLFQFLCSSNNNIARIEKMVWTLAGYGERLGEVGGFVFHRFPTVERLARVSEQELREAGFGYRAKYVVGTAKELMAKPGGGAKWLALLRDRELLEVIEGLCTLPGVGPKVAACIALFSLDKNQAIPVDTHVWKPNLASMLVGRRMFSLLASYLLKNLWPPKLPVRPRNLPRGNVRQRWLKYRHERACIATVASFCRKMLEKVSAWITRNPVETKCWEMF